MSAEIIKAERMWWTVGNPAMCVIPYSPSRDPRPFLDRGCIQNSERQLSPRSQSQFL